MDQNNNLPRPSNETNETQSGSNHLPSALFAIPFPKPVSGQQTSLKFLLYTFPRAIYEKPGIDPTTGKSGKEKLVKKVERKWQEEVKEAEEIKRGEVQDPSTWKKIKGFAARGASGVIKAIPDNLIEVLGRLPPQNKLGNVTIIHPDVRDTPPWIPVSQLKPDEMKRELVEMLTQTGKKARSLTFISGAMLPVTLAVDVLVIIPLFLFEINMAYFALQANGAKKINTLIEADKKAAQMNQPMPVLSQDQAQVVTNSIFIFETARPGIFNRTIEHLYEICSSLDPKKFPPVNGHQISSSSSSLDKNSATDLINQFLISVPPEFVKRHQIEVDRIAEDLHRSLTKAAKEYIKTLQ